MLVDSERYGEWADARFERIDPPGPVVPGQVMLATSNELGLRFMVRLKVLEVDPHNHRVSFDVDLPFGLKERTTISATPLDAARTRVQYG